MLENGGRHFRLMRWGLIPRGSASPKIYVADRRALRNDPRQARVQECHQAAALPGSGGRRLRTAGCRWLEAAILSIHRRDGQPVGFAALARNWTGPNGEETDSVAYRHRARGPDLATLHHRVPVTIAPEEFDAGSQPDQRRRRCHGAAARTARGEFAWHEISTRVNPASSTTTRNCCCRSPTRRGRRRSRGPRSGPRRAR